MPSDDMEKFFDELLTPEEQTTASKEVVLVKKVCMLGNPGVGKTSLINRYVYSMFNDKYIATIGAKVTKKNLVVNNPASAKTFKIKLMIWDIAGQGTLDWIKPTYYRDAEGALIVADVTRRATLDDLAKWVDALYQTAGTIPVFFLINKFDLYERAEFRLEEAAKIAQRYNTSALKSSAKTGENVEAAFQSLGNSLVERFIEKRGAV